MDKSPRALFGFVPGVGFNFDVFKNPVFFHILFTTETQRGAAAIKS
jgi:hypothetical protein